MPLIKKKISELPLADSLKGLYTIGYKIIDGIKTSVKVSLEDIQTAYQDVVNAIKKSEEATRNANNAAVTANEKASLANTAAANANDTAEHPTYIGTDHYVYKWNKTAQAYDKTDIYTKGDAFSIKKVYVSVAEMEADKGNPDIAEGDFALVNTGDVEDPDNAKLYVKAAGDYEFLVDMSGAIGFTGKTPQFSMGTVTTLEAGVSAIVTVSDDGTDDGGNPKYKINFAIPRGNPGAPFRISGEYATLEALKSAVPDGSAVDGFMAVGTEAPYDYYAWVNGEWVSQGKIGGIDEAPTDGKAYGRKNGNWAEVPEKSDVLTKTNSESFTPTGDYQPATKKYVDDKHIMLTITDEAHIQLISNQEVKAGEADSKINLVFGSIDNFKNIIHRLLSDNILFLKITEKEIFKVSTSHTYCNPDNGAYELSFIYTYTSIADANNISLVTKRIFIALNSNATNFFVVKDILVSDNLTTLTKKTAAEYEAIGSKDANTAYCVTD